MPLCCHPYEYFKLSYLTRNKSVIMLFFNIMIYSVGTMQLRYDQSVSLQRRGLLRFPVTSNVSFIKFAQSSTGTSCTGSKPTTPKPTGPSSIAETPLPRLEEWPCFPSPATAFAPAAPVESPKGLMPPSHRLLRYIHQVCSYLTKHPTKIVDYIICIS